MHAMLTLHIRNVIPFFVFCLLFVKQVAAQQTAGYPKVVGYFSTSQSIATYSDGHFTGNFGKVYTINFPFGMNILKSDHFGVSFEVAPAIRTESNISKVSAVAFNPGAMFRLKNGFTILQRLSFETSGRYGTTTVFNKILIKGKDANLFAAVPLPLKFGNGAPASLGIGLQVGVIF